MADGEIKINTKLDTSGLDKGLKDVKAKMDATGKTIDNGTKQTKSFASSLKNITTGAAATAAGVAAVGVAVKKTVDALNDCAAAYRVQQKAEIALQTAAKNNPYLNDEAVYSLKQYASELQSVSEIGDEMAIQIMAQLAATGRNEEQIRQIMSAAADMAAVTGQDLASAAQQLNQTLNGTAGTLGRQIEGINDLTKAELENGKAIEIVAAQYKGSAAEMADNTVQLKNAWGDFKENIGRGWDNVTKPVRQFFLDVLTDINDATAKTNALKDARKNIASGTETSQDIKLELEAQKALLDEMEKNKGMTERKGGILSGYMVDPKWEEKHTKQLELVTELQTKYDGLVEKEKAAAKAAEDEAAATKKANDQKKEAEQRDKDAQEHIDANTKALNQNIAAMKMKAELLGEEVDAGEMYNAYMNSYIDLVTKSNGLVTENNKAAQKRLETLLQWKELAEAAAATEEERLAAQQKADELAKQYLNDLMADIAAANELLDAAHGEKQLSAIEKHAAKEKELAELKEKIIQNEILKEQEKADAILDIDKQIAQNRLDTWEDITSQIAGYIQQLTDIMQKASDLMLDKVTAESNAELAELEKKYAAGEVAESEYYNKQQEIRRKAAREEYKIKMFEWTSSMLSATANIAEGVTKAIAMGGVAGVLQGLLVGAAGAVQLASIMASRPIPPSFYTGGIIGGANGASMGGDNTYIHARRGEMVINAAQQRALWDVVNGQGTRAQLGLNLTVNNTQSGRVDTQIRQENGGYVIDILDKHINKGFSDGSYDAGLAAMNTRQEGVRIL